MMKSSMILLAFLLPITSGQFNNYAEIKDWVVSRVVKGLEYGGVQAQAGIRIAQSYLYSCSNGLHSGNLALSMELRKNLMGQPLVATRVLRIITEHAQQEPKRALSMIFSGSTGVGKNFVSIMIGTAIFKGDDFRNYFHVLSVSDFPAGQGLDQLSQELYNRISKDVQRCPYSIFVFDECDKYPSGVLDVLRPFLEKTPFIKGTDYRRATFLFITNVGGAEINEIFAKEHNRGVERAKMAYHPFERIVERTMKTKNVLRETLDKGLVGYIIPFFPLYEAEVRGCVNVAMESQQVPEVYRSETLAKVLGAVEFEDGRSKVGCKKIDTYVAMLAPTPDDY